MTQTLENWPDDVDGDFVPAQTQPKKSKLYFYCQAINADLSSRELENDEPAIDYLCSLD